ncbi:malto-oligosyltrehalose trehalohydrolase [Planctomicrobium sp. SH664]|uniref:malto-oligosyltrehalose trehalohydrolase n=1 Tax=Planctomicrobium sp. SH664 TaxID=3448125 RepID=UPI003F5B03CF
MKQEFQAAPQHPQVGAIKDSHGNVRWSVWAPSASAVELVLNDRSSERFLLMDSFDGYHTLSLPNVSGSVRYAYRINGREYPDPASRWQPEGVFGRSAIAPIEEFDWQDEKWPGLSRENLIIYEIHIGTFSASGTFAGVIPRLSELRELGVTALEIMPVGQFSGERNWGYDGVFPFAVQNSYGGPIGLQELVQAAHSEGMAVLLDVVYNHLGPEGNILHNFGPYFTTRYQTPWGEAFNFDGPQSDAVRHFVLENVTMWIRDFHLDGLRLDAVHAMYDLGARHVLAEIQTAAQRVAAEQSRLVHIIAESNQNDPRLIDPQTQHGFGLDGVWADEFHHSLRAVIAGDRQGFFSDYGRPEDLAKAITEVFVHDGCYSRHRQRQHGAAIENRDRTQFVVCIHNHDQIGNRALGDRSASYLPEAVQRLSCGLLMLSPCVPLLFMGEEYAETQPFPFFCSFQSSELIEAVRRGRREEFLEVGFTWGEEIPDPQAEDTFRSAILSWSWPEGSFGAQLRGLFRDLIRARRSWPPLQDRQWTRAEILRPDDTAVLLVIERGEEEGLIAIANLTESHARVPEISEEKQLIFSTEGLWYGGSRDLTHPLEGILPYEVLIFGKVAWCL